MNWTSLTPFVPYARLFLVLAFVFLLISIGIQVRNRMIQNNSKMVDALISEQKRVALSIVVALLFVFISSSSAHRPKDRIMADYSELEQSLEELEAADNSASPEVLLEKSLADESNWEDARDRFRNQIKKEEAQFEEATTE